MRPRLIVESPLGFLILMLTFALLLTPACTFNGDRPARALSEATGGEGLERVFWKEMQAANWVEVERALASNYAGVTPSGTQDRAAALEQYRGWQLKSYALGDLQTELNGNTFVVTYTITLNGTSNGSAGSQPLPSTPQHMMTVWQQQKKGWVVIAHSVSQ
ncbi:MAG: nuclear transport factor 2 family protein [Terriglobales bacterium]